MFKILLILLLHNFLEAVLQPKLLLVQLGLAIVNGMTVKWVIGRSGLAVTVVAAARGALRQEEQRRGKVQLDEPRCVGIWGGG